MGHGLCGFLEAIMVSLLVSVPLVVSNLSFLFFFGETVFKLMASCLLFVLPLEPHLQSILLWLFFWRRGLSNYFPPAGLQLRPS
jgi:hypothetical protein